MEQIIKANLLIKEILVRIVVLIVIGRNLININIIATIGVGLIAGLESDKWGKIIGLTGEYGQLIIEYGIVATIFSVIAVLIMGREKKEMERVGLIGLAILGMIILVSVKDVLTVYLAMEAQSLAFYTLAGWAVIPFGTGAVLADINIGILYLFAVSSLGVYAVLCFGWASNSRYSFLSPLRATAQMISYEISIGLIILSEYGHVILMSYFNVLFFLSEYGHEILMSYFNVLLFWGGWLSIINIAPFIWIPEVIWLGITVSFFLFLFIWTRASLLL